MKGKKSIHQFFAVLGMLVCILVLGNCQKMETKAASNHVYLLKGEKLTVQLKTGQKNTRYTWKSKNKKIATVNQKGVVTGKKKGNVYITATYKKKNIKVLVTVRDEVDLFIFAGQSNMSGGGNATLAPTVKSWYGYEYRSVTAPNTLSPLKEPFGVKENSGNLNDYNYKQGSMVSSFVKEYYCSTRTPVVAINATRIGSSLLFWKNNLCEETANRYKKCVKYLKKRGIKIRHSYVVWWQGEAEGIYKCSGSYYIDNTKDVIRYFKKNCNMEKLLMVRIGQYYGTEVEVEPNLNANLFDEIIRSQTKIALENKDVVLVSVKAAGYQADAYNPEGLHLNQYALNEIGKESGKNAAYYVKNRKQPPMFDSYLNTWIK